MDLTVRKMEPNEAEAVQKIGKNCFVGFERLILHKPKKALLAICNDEITAAVMYRIITVNEIMKVGFIEFAFVKKEHQGRGIGNVLYEAVINLFNDMGCKSVTALVADDNVASWKIFENKGFKSISFIELYNNYGFPGSLKICYETMFAWAIGHKMWHTGVSGTSGELSNFIVFLTLNMFIILPRLLYFRSFKSILVWTFSIYVFILLPVVMSKIASLFLKSKWRFEAIRGGFLTSLFVSMIGGSLPGVGRLYPLKYENSSKQIRQLGLIALIEWITILLLIVILSGFRLDYPILNMSIRLGKIFLFYHSVPFYPFASFGAGNIWKWNVFLSVLLLIISVLLFFL